MPLTKVQIGMTDAPTSGTAVTASGTSVDFTGIPSTAKRITVMFSGVSTNGTSNVQIQIGTSGGVQTSGYTGNAWQANTINSALSAGFLITPSTAATHTINGIATLALLDSSSGIWAFTSVVGVTTYVGSALTGGAKTLSGTLDRIRITTVNGTDTFDAGTINIMWE
jgi:hypothetical protein